MLRLDISKLIILQIMRWPGEKIASKNNNVSLNKIIKSVLYPVINKAFSHLQLDF